MIPLFRNNMFAQNLYIETFVLAYGHFMCRINRHITFLEFLLIIFVLLKIIFIQHQKYVLFNSDIILNR